MIETIWEIKKTNLHKVAELAHELEIPNPVAQIYVGRNLETPEQVADFTKLGIKYLHNPYLLPDIKPVLERLHKALDNKEKIFIWGDYDVDGITSTSVVVTTLRRLGAEMAYKVPHRTEDGYDIRTPSVDQALAADAKLLFSVDCGIVAFEAANYAKEKGLDLIITDHHHPSSDGRIPECIGVVNPNRDDPAYPGEHFAEHAKPGFKRYPFDSLAGVGIAFKVMMALALERGVPMREMLDELIEYVALGTVADVAPMVDENRTLVHAGCIQLTHSDKSGMIELLKVAGVKKVTTTSIGFNLGPRINAIGRLADAGTALDLLLEKNENRAKALALQLDTANRRRQQQQEQVTEEAIALVESQYDLENTHIIVVGAKGWHPGLIGLIAGKLAEKYGKPALVCSIKEDGYAKGSCRSTRSFNILNALKSPKAWELFKKRADGSVVCGGHAFAAGFEMPETNLKAMSDALNEYAASIVGDVANNRIIEIDARIQPREINARTYEAMMRMSPFGAENPLPVFVAKNMEIVGSKVITSGKHLKLKLKGANGGSWVEANAWRRGPEADKWCEGAIVDIVFTMAMEEWGGRNSLTLTLEDIRASEKK
jgi:single-stranded-DNA-specific exonuclease